jgi:hypothetical protein
VILVLFSTILWIRAVVKPPKNFPESETSQQVELYSKPS